MSAWIPAALVFAAVAFATIALVLVVEGVRTWYRRKDIAQRVDQIVSGQETSPANDPSADLFRPRGGEEPTVLEVLLSRIPRFRDVPLLIEHAGVSWSANTFVLLTLGVSVAAGLAVTVMRGGMLIPLVAAGFAAWMPYTYLKFRKSRKLAKFEETFPDAIDMLGRAIRAGHPLSAGIQMVGQEMVEPVGSEFRTLVEEQRFGVPFADALMSLVDRIDLVDVRIFSTAILVQREVGGNLAEILDNISDTIRARFKIRRQLRTYTAQGRMSGLVVGLMPFAVGVAFYAINPDYVRVLFEHPIGRMMLAFAITLQIFGYLWIRKVVNIEI
jgi:tight adherence protein B